MYVLQLMHHAFICDVAGTLSLYRFYIQTGNCLDIIKQCFFSNSSFIVLSFCAADMGQSH